MTISIRCDICGRKFRMGMLLSTSNGYICLNCDRECDVRLDSRENEIEELLYEERFGL